MAEDYSAGQVVPCVQCDGYSYVLRLPKGYDSQRDEKWPVLFIMSAGGGKVATLDRYIPGADLCGWILAVSIESKNSNDGRVSHEAITSMVEDVFDRLPVNEKRCYSSGMSGGGREAFWMANQFRRNIIGMIPCGAGDCGNNVANDALAYGLCGANCFNRWDMTITFAERIRTRGVLRFFAGGHTWAQEPLITEAILWLNGKYLEDDGSENEISTFSRVLLEKASSLETNSPEFAYHACCVLSEIKGLPEKKDVVALQKKLATDPAVTLMLEAREDIAEFADEHFNTNVADCYDCRTTESSEEDSAELRQKYAGTKYEDLMSLLGSPSKEL